MRWWNGAHPLSSLVLASSDASGKILIWDVTEGAVLHTVQDGNRPVAGKTWENFHHELFPLGET